MKNIEDFIHFSAPLNILLVYIYSTTLQYYSGTTHFRMIVQLHCRSSNSTLSNSLAINCSTTDLLDHCGKAASHHWTTVIPAKTGKLIRQHDKIL